MRITVVKYRCCFRLSDGYRWVPCLRTYKVCVYHFGGAAPAFTFIAVFSIEETVNSLDREDCREGKSMYYTLGFRKSVPKQPAIYDRVS